MSRRRPTGSVVFTCAECSTRFCVMRHETLRAGGVKCTACGSRFVDLSKMGQAKIKQGNDAARESSLVVERKMGGAA